MRFVYLDYKVAEKHGRHHLFAELDKLYGRRSCRFVAVRVGTHSDAVMIDKACCICLAGYVVHVSCVARGNGIVIRCGSSQRQVALVGCRGRRSAVAVVAGSSVWEHGPVTAVHILHLIVCSVCASGDGIHVVSDVLP